MSDIQYIIREYGSKYRALHALPLHQIKAVHAIEFCRTSKFGGHVQECDECGHVKILYNSCRNRHCPKCQGLVKEKWLQDRRQDLFPVGYFHVVSLYLRSLIKLLSEIKRRSTLSCSRLPQIP